MKRRTNHARSSSARSGANRLSASLMEGMEPRCLLSTIVALTESNRLLKFDSETPGDILSNIAITGLQGGESVLGIDVRPKTGQLYALGSNERLYTINPNTGAATFVANLSAEPADSSNPFTSLSGADFGIDFNPLSDRLRVVSNGDQNLRIHPTTGAVVTDAPLQYAADELHEGESPFINDIAYSNNVPSANTSTLFGVDSNLAILVTHDSENAGTLKRVATFGKVNAPNRGFDIGPSGLAFAAKELQFPGESISFALVGANLKTGVDSSKGPIGDGTTAITDIAIVPSLQFSTGLYAGIEGRRAKITITRTEGDQETFTVRVASAVGTATAPGDYPIISRDLTFKPGDREISFQIPINNDAAAEDDEAFSLSLSAPTGGSVIGRPGRATVRISRNDKPDNDGPKLRFVGLTGPSRAISGAVFHFNEDLNAGRAETLGNFSITGISGNGDRQNIALRSATYDPNTRRVNVRVRNTFLQTQFKDFEIRVRSGGQGLADTAGNALDGSANANQSGGDEVVKLRIFSGRTVRFTDADGDRATLTIADGGQFDGVRPIDAPRGQRTQFWILDPISLRSRLSGSVLRSPTGDGLIVIAEIIGLDKKEFTPLLTSPSFRVNTLTFSSNATGIG